MKSIYSYFWFLPREVVGIAFWAILIFLAVKVSVFLYRRYLQAHMGPWIEWGNRSALLIGWPMLAILGFTCATRLVFSSTCLTVGYQCQHAFGVSEMAQQYLTSLVGGEADIVVQEKKKG